MFSDPARLGEFLAAAMLGMILGWFKRPVGPKPWQLVIAGLTCVVTLFVIIAIWTPQKAIITNLVTGDSVPHNLEVTVAAESAVPKGHRLRVANVPKDSHVSYWAEKPCALTQEGDLNLFSCPGLYVGRRGADDGTFSVYLFDVDTKADRALRTNGTAFDFTGRDSFGPEGATLLGVVHDLKREQAP